MKNIIEKEYITLKFNDSSNIKCEIGEPFCFENIYYIYLFPMDNTDDVYIYRYIPINNEEFDLVDIDDDNEFQRVSEYFEKIYSHNEEFLNAFNNLDSL